MLLALSALYNAGFAMALVMAGQLILSLFCVVAPLRLTLLIHSMWGLLLATPTGVAMALCLQQHCCNGNLGRGRGHWLRRLLVVMTMHALLAVGLRWVVASGCAPCPTPLPPRPFLVAHRGCSADAPENTMAAYQRAVQLPFVRVLESDVSFSIDGMAFLMHDPHALRTTDILQRCPSIEPTRNASWLAFSSGTCPISQLNAGHSFVSAFPAA